MDTFRTCLISKSGILVTKLASTASSASTPTAVIFLHGSGDSGSGPHGWWKLFPWPIGSGCVYHVEWRKSSHLFSLWILRLKRYIEALSDLVEELEFRDVQTFWPNSSPQPHHGWIDYQVAMLTTYFSAYEQDSMWDQIAQIHSTPCTRSIV